MYCQSLLGVEWPGTALAVLGVSTVCSACGVDLPELAPALSSPRWDIVTSLAKPSLSAPPPSLISHLSRILGYVNAVAIEELSAVLPVRSLCRLSCHRCCCCPPELW